MQMNSDRLLVPEGIKILDIGYQYWIRRYLSFIGILKKRCGIRTCVECMQNCKKGPS